ncbi:hypothetical protein FHL15_007072 [Xylaria flabelliformis]|uniref:Uncharacterized protein n=1 Tax=Xylaria flabelliformis TaxID=2512241 RepID=A0A553HVK1_9PEZI|nr:hypothetical protein FHL15_007072 [Xylaria flabelliformis]
MFAGAHGQSHGAMLSDIGYDRGVLGKYQDGPSMESGISKRNSSIAPVYPRPDIYWSVHTLDICSKGAEGGAAVAASEIHDTDQLTIAPYDSAASEMWQASIYA